MLCKSCGAEISNDLSFCPYCGAKILKPVQPNSAPDLTAQSQNPTYPMPSNQMPTNPMPTNPMPTNQMPTNSMPSNPMPTNPMPSNQMPSNQMPWGQIAQNMQAPNQSQPRQIPPYQMQGQLPPGQLPPNMMPPLPPQAPIPGKKNKALPIFIIVGALIFILICVIGAIKFVDYIKANKDSEEIITDPVNIVDNTEPAVTDIPEEASSDTSDQEDTSSTSPEDTALNFKYTYSELPDVISIDTDSRFSYQYYTSGTGTATYSFLFSDPDAPETDFYTAVTDYTTLMMTLSGFSYDEDINDIQLNNPTDDNTTYYSKDNMVIGVTASVETYGSYAYVTIVDQNSIDTSTDTEVNTDTTDTSSDTSTDTSTDTNTDTSTDSDTDTYTDSDTDTYTDTTGTENFYYYIGDREYEAFSQYSETIMDNGIEFYLNDIYLTDMGDGTSVLECSLDLSTTIENCEMYADDFLVIAYDIDGNMITDALTIENIEDSNGTSLTFPNKIDSDYYNSYKVTYTVPSNTDTVTFYGTNIELTESSGETLVVFSGPIYYMEIVFE